MWKKWFGKKDDNKAAAADYDKLDPAKIPKHIAIIMDGNGRWAQRLGMPRTFGHRAGVETLRDIVTTASELGVGVLTVYAFSTENWKRPSEEVELLMTLFSTYLDTEIDELHANNVKLRFIGRTDELAKTLQHKMDRAYKLTTPNNGLTLNIAVNYGGRAEIVKAAQTLARKALAGELEPEAITDQVISEHLYTAGQPDPDLVIRPSGDLRLSNFLIWQSAYAEFWFTDVNWPDFKPVHLIAAIADYQKRERRFGGLKK